MAVTSKSKFKAIKRKPVIFMFQPTKFETVSGARLKEWEVLMTRNVGFRGKFGGIASGTISCCPDCDDCDM